MFPSDGWSPIAIVENRIDLVVQMYISYVGRCRPIASIEGYIYNPFRGIKGSCFAGACRKSSQSACAVWRQIHSGDSWSRVVEPRIQSMSKAPPYRPLAFMYTSFGYDCIRGITRAVVRMALDGLVPQNITRCSCRVARCSLQRLVIHCHGGESDTIDLVVQMYISYVGRCRPIASVEGYIYSPIRGIRGSCFAVAALCRKS